MARRRTGMAHRERVRVVDTAVGLGIAAMTLGLVAIALAMSPPPRISTSPGATNRATPTTAIGLAAAAATSSSAATRAATASEDPAAPPPDPSPKPGATPSLFSGGLLIADRGNGRLLIVTDTGHIVWTFPGPKSLPRGQQFSADDAFIAPDGRTIVANDEQHEVIDRIDIATRRVTWQYGTYDRAGSGPHHLHTPDDAYPLANGDIVVADIRNCRILEISKSKRIVHQWGRTGVCVDRPPRSFAMPNGDTPLPDGGLLITEITGSRVVRLRSDGRVVFDVHVPVRYPSDAHLLPDGSILVVDYSAPGAIVRISPKGRVLWRYSIRRGPGALNHPSLAIPLANGMVALNDDFEHRVLVIDPRTDRIVWQYGRTGRPGRRGGYLNTPDGIDVVPAGTVPGVG